MRAIHDPFRGRWPGILAQLGVPSTVLTNRQGPCPLCGGKDRFRFDDREGEGRFYCNACGPGDGFDLVQKLHRCSFREALAQVRSVAGVATLIPIRRTFAATRSDLLRLWTASHPIQAGDPADRYLCARGLSGVRERSLRTSPKLAYRHGDGHFTEHPGLLALVQRPDGTGQTLFRTFLTNDGCKADVAKPKKAVATTNPPGAAVRLGAAVKTLLGVAEGVETALSVSRLFGVPCWAALGTVGLAGFQWPESVQDLMIFGDFDANYAGHAASYRLAHRASCAGVGVTLQFPPEKGSDWNDVLRQSFNPLSLTG